jgi:small subunit ribosomal protein S5
MTAKEIKTDNEERGPIEAVELSVPATGLDVAAVLPREALEGEAAKVVPDVASKAAKILPQRSLRRDNARRGPQSRSRARGEPRERVKPEFDSKIIDIRRVTRVAAGGRRYSFSAAVVAGDRKGRVGVGLGKGSDTALSVEKATREAKKNIVLVPLSAAMTIPHAVEGKFGAARIKMFPARGRGVVAGSSARAVIELAGIKDVCAKFLSGSKNRLNNARAAVNALEQLSKVSRRAARGPLAVEK